MKTTTEAIVIWENKTGEADRVITLLTPGGVVTAYARGSLKPGGKLSAPTAMLSYSDFELFAGKNMFTVDDAQIRHRFVRLFSDAESYALAVYFCEILKMLAPVDDDAGDFMSLTLNALHLLGESKRARPLVKSVFELRAAAYAGYAPDLVSCADCGAYDPESGGSFDILEGVYRCADCARKAGLALNCSGALLKALRHILYSELKQAFAFELSGRSGAALSQLSENYLTAKLERSLPTLAFYKSIATP